MRIEGEKVAFHASVVASALFLLSLSALIGDLRIVQAVYFGRPRWLDPVVVLFTNFGDYIFGAALFLVLLASVVGKVGERWRRAAILGIVGWIVLDLVLTEAVKTLVARPRPYVLDPNIKPLGFKTSPYKSFPSGHTVTAFTFATSVSLFSERKSVQAAMATFAVLMGLSRIYCGVHYLSDVVAGALIGLYGTLALNALFSEIWKKGGE